MMDEKLAKGLTEEQKIAVSHREGPMLVLASAGSGKTRTVTSRIAHLIHLGIPPSSIVGVTFTNKAAHEMKERIEKMVHHKVLISTFHSLGARILRESSDQLSLNPTFSIYDEEDQEKVIKECLIKEGMHPTPPDIKTVKAFFSQCKNRGVLPDEKEPLAHVFYLYQEKLKSYGAVDFDDLIFLTMRSLREHPEVLKTYHERWHYFLIDEYQDTNKVQCELIKLLAGRKENIFAVGDPDQSIYSWRGSTLRNILHFERDFREAHVVRLEENFRSTNTILQAANSLIENNRDRYEKRLWSNLGEGEKVSYFVGGNEKEEASFIAETIEQESSQGTLLSEMSIFYRTNAQSRPFEDELLKRSIPYTIIGGISFYQRKEIKDILSFLKMADSDLDFLAFLRTVNLPKKGIGETTLQKIQSAWPSSGLGLLPFLKSIVYKNSSLSLPQKQRNGLERYIDDIETLRMKKKGAIAPLLSYAIHDTGYLSSLKEEESFEDRKENLNELFAKGLEWDMKESLGSLSLFLEELSLKTSNERENQGSVKLMTLHNSKGLEFSHVFIAGIEEDLLPHINSRESEENIEEERRLLYVGITRAKEKLFLCRSLERLIWGQKRSPRRSRFMEEIDPKTLERVEKKKRTLPEKALKPGDKVMHADFGIGEIQEATMESLGLVYKVYFIKTGSVKSLFAPYAPLHKLGGG